MKEKVSGLVIHSAPPYWSQGRGTAQHGTALGPLILIMWELVTSASPGINSKPLPQKQPISERASLPLRCIPRASVFPSRKRVHFSCSKEKPRPWKQTHNTGWGNVVNVETKWTYHTPAHLFLCFCFFFFLPLWAHACYLVSVCPRSCSHAMTWTACSHKLFLSS